MNLHPKLANYYRGPKLFIIITIIFALILGGAIYFLCSLPKPDNNEITAREFDLTETEEYCYIDVVGVSNWLYNDDDRIFYTVIDKFDNYYTVRIDDDTYEKMTAMYDYFLHGDEDGYTRPEPLRIYGYSFTAYSGLVDSLAYSWDITSEQYHIYFGDYYLDTDRVPTNPIKLGIVFIIILSSVSYLFFMLFELSKVELSRLSFRRLKELNLEESAAEELNEENLHFEKQKITLSKSFIYNEKNKYIFKYDDIFWTYIITSSVYHMIILSLTMKKEVMARIGFNGSLKTDNLILSEINKRSPQTLVGFTDNNKQAYINYKKN